MTLAHEQANLAATHPAEACPGDVDAARSAGVFALERQPGETVKAFEAFTVYLNLGPDRSLMKTARQLHKTKRLMQKWSAKYKWLSRIAEYHAHLARIERDSTETLAREKCRDWVQLHEQVRRQTWAEGEELLAMAQEFKARWRESDRLPEFGAVLRAMELGFRLKQFAAGMPSEVKAVNATLSGVERDPARLEFEAALKKIYGQPLPGEVIDVQATPPAASSALGESTATRIVEAHCARESAPPPSLSAKPLFPPDQLTS